MATGQIRKTGIDPAAKADAKSGNNVDPGPYEAVVVKHATGTRMGQLLVYIPDWGGTSTDPNNQTLVSYASPFFGTTYGTDQQNSNPDSPYTAGQSYGMWFVPPDVGNKVLVTFVAGDRMRGYWFACCYDSQSHHMVPGLARNVGGAGKTLPPNPPDQITSSIGSNSILPVVEAYSGNSTEFTEDAIKNNPRFLHEYQAGVLIGQGLDRDPVRGAISSSSLREGPSNVYGISTPGRSVSGKSQQFPSTPGYEPKQAVAARKGGHTFVMDDGDEDGNDQLIRLRTTGGHQILMNDSADKTDKSAGVLYIGSASGSQWIEFSSDGSINMYGVAGFNVRSKGALNLHSDSAVNINSGGSVNINGDMGVKITSMISASIEGMVSASVKTAGSLTLTGVGKAQLSSGGPMSVGSAMATLSLNGKMMLLNGGEPSIPVPPVPNLGNQLPDVLWGGTSWTYTPSAVKSICSVVPSHEPWLDPATKLRPTPAKGAGLAGLGIGAATSLGAGVASKLL